MFYLIFYNNDLEGLRVTDLHCTFKNVSKTFYTYRQRHALQSKNDKFGY